LTAAIPITDSNFIEKVTRSKVPVLVDFWAEWCGPCKTIAPMLDVIAEKYVNELKVYKIDVMTYTSVASQYGVQMLPTLLLFKDGMVVDNIIGSVKMGVLLEKIERII
jgi:thioredoxin 1